MLLYSSRTSPRLEYITEFIGKELFSEGIQITVDKHQFELSLEPKLNYGAEVLSDAECRIGNCGLLFEPGIREQPTRCFETRGYTAFFATPGYDMAFDIFAAAFYLVSRYEEYLPHEKDEYGRYAHVNSLASKENFLHLPLVNIWLEDFKGVLTKKFPGITFREKEFRFIPTYDIDIAYSYRHKGFARTLGGVLRSVLKADLYGLIGRITVMLRLKHDPFDCYGWLNALHKSSGVKPYYFFLVAEKQVGYDKNISPNTAALQLLIRRHSDIYTVGIHPSWRSVDDPRCLIKEIELLRQITGKSIIHSRQHYIRLRLPATYRELIKAGIKKDFSMGYGTVNGFRASVASSFNWYDLEKEETTGLVIYPFCFMDANAYYEQKLDPASAYKELENYYNAIKSVQGLMITVWHNHLLGTDRAFSGWREAYARFMRRET